ncbi:30S ribosomal protein S3 [Calothrix sp. NIES-4071]|nr:30S ribosomal protein S3 [Calothrix sp. NIES-4071]BAZ60144.1 30S ribosomal protein S3 [Calothrix sp. NIES-4105]
MGQKIHPVGFRLGITQEHQSRWFADPSRYPELLQEDFKLRKYIDEKLGRYAQNNAGISEVRIERKADQIDLEVRTARPGVVVGRGGQGIESLRTGLQQLLGSNRQIRINVVEVQRVDANAFLIAEYVAQQLERRVSFRRVVRQAIQRAQRAGVQGIKIQVSGRLNGAEIARTEASREGSVPLHTLRADIDYAYCTAKTIYGILGIKVWVFKGEIIPGQEDRELAPVGRDRGDRDQRGDRGDRDQRRRGAGRRRQQFEDRSNEG